MWIGLYARSLRRARHTVRKTNDEEKDGEKVWTERNWGGGWGYGREEKTRGRRRDERKGSMVEVSARPRGFAVVFREPIDSRNAKDQQKWTTWSRYRSFCTPDLNVTKTIEITASFERDCSLSYRYLFCQLIDAPVDRSTSRCNYRSNNTEKLRLCDTYYLEFKCSEYTGDF